jgi:hypothetical protein
MTPDEKEQVVVELKARGHFPLMCGDGANDVGALKQVRPSRHRRGDGFIRLFLCAYLAALSRHLSHPQAHVGIALLSGFGSANATRDDASKKDAAALPGPAVAPAAISAASVVPKKDPQQLRKEAEDKVSPRE